jgi:hypothetical protein
MDAGPRILLARGESRMTTNRDPPSDERRKVVLAISGIAGAKATAKMGSAMLQGSAEVTPSVAVDPYAYRWLELRRRQARVLYAAVACLTVGAVGACLLPSSITRYGVVLGAAAAMIPFVAALGSYPCPRCKKPFFERSGDGRANYFAKQCLHCGLTVGTSKADAQAALDEPAIRIIL